MKIESPSFTDSGSMPARYTCDGSDISPPLEWSGVPKSAKSLALIVDDPDAPDPDAPKTTWVHWVLYNIPTEAAGFEEDIKKLPVGTCEGENDWKKIGYGGPCPPIGRHRYFFKLYALDTLLQLEGKVDKQKLEEAMRGHILTTAALVGTYKRL